MVTICGQSGAQCLCCRNQPLDITRGEQSVVSLQLQKRMIFRKALSGSLSIGTGIALLCNHRICQPFRYQSQFTLEIGENAEIWLKHEKSKEFLPASRDEIAGGDMLEAELSNGIATVLRFTRGNAEVRFYRLHPMEFVCASHNSFITLLTDDGQVRSFEIGRECALQYSGASAGDSLCCGKEGLGLNRVKELLYAIVRIKLMVGWKEQFHFIPVTIIQTDTRRNLFCTICI